MLFLCNGSFGNGCSGRYRLLDAIGEIQDNIRVRGERCCNGAILYLRTVNKYEWTLDLEKYSTSGEKRKVHPVDGARMPFRLPNIRGVPKTKFLE
mmetsp:Transcript_24319/g.39521  ORF Transcript_24319/g.39521 Transcript_24319/m.39521 type:complete len:95 (-) Transcript_24319:815-1099(-)